jgi:hypothetical protein
MLRDGYGRGATSWGEGGERRARQSPRSENMQNIQK